jgi:hypothetical protein
VRKLSKLKYESIELWFLSQQGTVQVDWDSQNHRLYLRINAMATQLYKTVSLSSKGVQNPKLARNISVAVPSPVLRSLTNANALRSTISTAKTADFVDITFRYLQK